MTGGERPGADISHVPRAESGMIPKIVCWRLGISPTATGKWTNAEFGPLSDKIGLVNLYQYCEPFFAGFAILPAP
jgi:hypothetical protein